MFPCPAQFMGVTGADILHPPCPRSGYNFSVKYKDPSGAVPTVGGNEYKKNPALGPT